jgi:hypothetical protein
MAAYWGGSVGFLRSLLGRSLSALAFPRADGGCTTGGVTCGGRDTAGGGTTGAGLMAGRCGPLRDGAGCGVGGVWGGGLGRMVSGRWPGLKFGRCGSVRGGAFSGGLGIMRCCGGTMFLFSGFLSTCGGGTFSARGGRGSLILFLSPGLGRVGGTLSAGNGLRLGFWPPCAGGRSGLCGFFSGVMGGAFGLRGVSSRFGLALGGCSAGCAARTSLRGILGGGGRSNRGCAGSWSGTLNLAFQPLPHGGDFSGRSGVSPAVIDLGATDFFSQSWRWG